MFKNSPQINPVLKLALGVTFLYATKYLATQDWTLIYYFKHTIRLQLL